MNAPELAIKKVKLKANEKKFSNVFCWANIAPENIERANQKYEDTK